MFKHLIRNVGLLALGVCILASAVEIHDTVKDYKQAEVKKFQIMQTSVETMGKNASGMTATIIRLADALPQDVMNNPLPTHKAKIVKKVKLVKVALKSR